MKKSPIKEMLEDMNQELSGFHKVMDKFDEFERIEYLKTAIHDKLCSIAHSKLETWASDMARFSISILTGDIVVIPLPEKGLFAIGRVMGGYEYNSTDIYTRHFHNVEWLNMQVPFPELKEELNGSSSVFLLTGDAREKILDMLVSKRIRQSELI
jgi:predicted Mrr-cat superfamily restriction endonuclease